MVVLGNPNTYTISFAGQQGGANTSQVTYSGTVQGGISMIGCAPPAYGAMPGNNITLSNSTNPTIPPPSSYYGGGGFGGGNVSGSSQGSGLGGGAGGYLESYLTIPTPASPPTYTITIGAGGQGGIGDGARNSCGGGGNGLIIVEEYF